MQTNRQTDKQTDRQTDKQTDSRLYMGQKCTILILSSYQINFFGIHLNTDAIP